MRSDASASTLNGDAGNDALSGGPVNDTLDGGDGADVMRGGAGQDLVSYRARTTLIETWRGNARKRLPELLASLDERLATFGDAAYLLEPDLKEARGGFRDVSMLRALAASWLTDRPHVGIREPYERLLDVRDALHLASGRTLDRIKRSIEFIIDGSEVTLTNELRKSSGRRSQRTNNATALDVLKLA